MRVFHLVKGLGRGGAETLLVRSAKTPLAAQRRNAYGYFLPWKDELVGEIENQGCVVKCFKAGNPLQMAMKIPELIFFLRSWRPDVIHCHLPLAGVIGRLLGRALRIPVVYSEHNLQERYHPLTRVANRLTWRWQDRVIAVSDEVRESIGRNLPPKPSVTTIVNGVDCEVFSRDLSLRALVREQFGLSEQDLLVGTVAVFRKQKRLDLWLEVARRVSREFDNVHFVIVGDGPERDVVERLVVEFGLEERVHLPGLRSDVLAYYSAMDTFVMSSDFEGLPVALLEAMACGVPVVCTKAGGIAEVVRDGVEGLLTNLRDVNLMTAKLTRICRHAELRQSLGRASRQRVLSGFSLTQMRSQIEEIYKSVSGAKGSSFPTYGLAGYELERSPSSNASLDLVRLALGGGTERSPRTPEFFSWKHSQSPFGQSFSLGVRCLRSADLVGLRLFQPWNFLSGGDSIRGVRAVDTCTHPDHQRKGIFSYLTRLALQDLASEKVDLVFNTPNKKSLPGYLKLGWELFCEVPIMIRAVPVGRRVTGSHDRQSLEDVLRMFSVADVEHLLAATRVDSGFQIDKSLRYLQWRYSGHPTVKYYYSFLSEANELRALAVWCETSRFGLRELALCELFSQAPPAASELIVDILSKSCCHFAVTAFRHPSYGEGFWSELGFRRVPLKTLSVTVLPLVERLRPRNSLNLIFSTGDLQIF